MSLVNEIDKLLGDYRVWLKERTALKEIDGSWVEITTPYLDRHNDALQIYAKQERGGFILSDDRYIIHDLEASGCNLNTGKRQELLRMTLSGFGIKLTDDALEVYATPENFPVKKHNLVQAMLAVNDLFYLAKPTIESLFFEDVVAWLDNNEIRYSPKIKINGTSGYDHLFDFIIPKSRTQPERVVQAITRPTRDTAETFIYRWSDTRDTRELRSVESKAFAILNDVQPIASGVLEALSNYSIEAVRWSERERIAPVLAA